MRSAALAAKLLGGGLATEAGRTAANIGGGIIRGAAANVITQGVAVATGLQDRFDWTGVAVGAVVGGVSSGVSGASGMPRGDAWTPAGMINGAVSGAAGALAGAATRSLIDGTDFGDNILATLPDVIGSTIGNAIGAKIGSQLAGNRSDERAERTDAMLRGMDRADERYAAGNPGSYEVAALGNAYSGSPTNKSNWWSWSNIKGTLKSTWDALTHPSTWVGKIRDAINYTKQSTQSLRADLSSVGDMVSEVIVTANTRRDAEAESSYTGRYITYMSNRRIDAQKQMAEAFQPSRGPMVDGGGVDSLIHTGSSVLKLGGGAVAWAVHPWTGTFDATIGSTLNQATARAPHGSIGGLDYDLSLPTTFAGDSALTIGGFFVGGPAGGARPTSLGRSAITAAELDVLPALSPDALPTGKSLILRPVEIEFPAGGLTSKEQGLFSAHLAEQEATLNRLSLFSPDDLALNLQNYQNVGPQIAKARSLARGYLPGSGQGLDAAHALDSVAGGYVNEFVGFRDPVQQRIGALWRTRASQIVPGREHMLTPRFDK